MTDSTGNFNFGQQGGVNNQTYINQAPPPLTFTTQLGEKLVEFLPKNKKIGLFIVGPESSSFDTGEKIKNFLISKGFQVDFGSAGMLIPRPEHRFVWDAAATRLTVTPSVLSHSGDSRMA